MRRTLICTLLSIALASALISAAAAAERAPAGSFLTHRVTSVNQLCDQMQTDPAVRLRYARHFGVSPDEITDYFAKNIKLVSLDEPLRTTTWYVGKSGKVYTKTKLFPKGTMVFADMSGKPLLSWSCGNPVTAHLPVVKKPVEEVKVLPTVETIAAAAITAPPAPEVLATTPVAAPPPTGVFSVPPVAIPPAVSNPSLWWLPMLALIPPPPPPVPEPASLLAMAVGITGMVGLRIRRSRDHR